MYNDFCGAVGSFLKLLKIQMAGVAVWGSSAHAGDKEQSKGLFTPESGTAK